MTGGAGAGGGAIKPADNSKVVPIGKGVGVVFRGNDGETNKARSDMATMAEMDASLAKLDKLEEASPSLLNPIDRMHYEKQRDRAIASLETTWNVGKGQGAMSEGDKVVTDRAIGALSGMGRVTGDSRQLIADTRADLNRRKQALLNSASGMVVKQSIGQDVHGNTIEQWTPTGEVYGNKEAPLEGKKSSAGVTYRPIETKK